jgi:hypothetical protein
VPDFRGGVDLFDPLILFVMRPGFPDAGTYLGPDRVAEYTRGLLEPWTRLTIEAEEVADAGDSVFAAVRQLGVGTRAARRVPLLPRVVFRGRKVIRFETFRERAEALEAIGLRE